MLPAKGGCATLSLDDEPKDMVPLFETILNYIPAPQVMKLPELRF